MPNFLSIPETLLHLIEKRLGSERREPETRSSGEESDSLSSESDCRRSADRRSESLGRQSDD